MKRNLILWMCVSVSLLSPAISMAQTLCRGQVKAGTMVVEVILDLPAQLQSGKKMGLNHPITEDLEPEIQLTIQKTIQISSGQRILAIYDDPHFSGVLNFEIKSLPTGEISLSDFKGFEGVTPFGPAELRCSRD